MPVRYHYNFFEKLQDITATIRGIWFLIIFNLIALGAFLIAPQGTDVLLSVAEDVGNAHFKPISTICLVLALFFWSVASEFCARFLIYLTDNSGRLLDPIRVKARKHYQKILSRVFLFFPMGLMVVAFIKAFFINLADLEDVPNIVYGLIAILILLGLGIWALHKLYIKNYIVVLSRKYKRFRWIAISQREGRWVTKLFGILNYVRVEIDATEPVTANDLRGTPYEKHIFFPDKNYLDPVSGNPYKDDDKKIWLYKIETRFYKCLLRQMAILGLSALLIVFTVGVILPSVAYFNIGAAAIICFAFASWQVIYVWLHFFDKYQSVFPARFFLIVMLVVTTLFNRDHPVREVQQPNAVRLPLQQHFANFYNDLNADTTGKYFRSGDSIPVIFIAAEGGALRTGAFTALMLAKLQDSFPQLNKYIYCYSGVSGGALGVNFFNAACLQKKDTTFAAATTTFFKRDFLAAVTAKLMFSDVINAFIPWHINRFDRAIALERAWEDAWPVAYPQLDSNLLKQPFDYTVRLKSPALFINTTEVETGQQCIWSNVALTGLPLEKQRDLYARTNLNLRYSTAINLSTRFPLISPGAAMFYNDETFSKTEKVRRHFVDGGYYENKGAETLFQVLQALPLQNTPVKIKPYVIQFNFGEEDTLTRTGITSFNEIKEIVTGIYNTRNGRGNITQHYLQQYVKQTLKGEFISLHLANTTKQIPMNWFLSNTAVMRLKASIEKSIALRADDHTELRKLFFYDTMNRRGN